MILYLTQRKHTHHPVRGITLLVAIIVTTVILSVALALLDVSYKQQLLASTSKQSQYSFYNADTAMECALYWDQKVDAFDFTPPVPAPSITCSSQPITTSSSVAVSGGGSIRTTTFTIPCASGGVLGTVTILKSDGTALCSATNHTCVYTTGYSTCDVTDPRRIERGLKVLY